MGKGLQCLDRSYIMWAKRISSRASEAIFTSLNIQILHYKTSLHAYSHKCKERKLILNNFLKTGLRLKAAILMS